MQKLVKIIYGVTEGPWHGKRLKKQLLEQGYGITEDIAKADYIFAHSGGCYEVVLASEWQKVVLVNPTYWPGKTMVQRARLKVWHDAVVYFRSGLEWYWLKKAGHSLFYLFRYLPKWLDMSKKSKQVSFDGIFSHSNTLLVRNDHDPWLTSDLATLKESYPSIEIHTLPGYHDDCWYNPNPYVALLAKL